VEPYRHPPRSPVLTQPFQTPLRSRQPSGLVCGKQFVRQIGTKKATIWNSPTVVNDNEVNGPRRAVLDGVPWRCITACHGCHRPI
jgi:hypothetical protein